MSTSQKISGLIPVCMSKMLNPEFPLMDQSKCVCELGIEKKHLYDWVNEAHNKKYYEFSV